MMRLAAALCLLAVLTMPSLAVQPDEVLPNAALEQRARDLSAGLRCMVCQNQSIDDSDAPLARDLRLLVRERLVSGDSDDEVVDFLVARYGEFVLLRPRLHWQTVLLWGFPLIVLAAGATFAIARARRAGRSEATLSADEEEALRQALADRSRK